LELFRILLVLLPGRLGLPSLALERLDLEPKQKLEGRRRLLELLHKLVAA
jgi:hypothetical protein